MSDKLRPVAEVWGDAWLAWDMHPSCSDEKAIAVIEADRQAVRAALVAEIAAWLREGEKEFSDCDIAANMLESGEWKLHL